MHDNSFKLGKQPCEKFLPQQDLNGSNRHICWKCPGLVSFCENCCFDHHQHGLESCITGLINESKPLDRDFERVVQKEFWNILY